MAGREPASLNEAGGPFHRLLGTAMKPRYAITRAILMANLSCPKLAT